MKVILDSNVLLSALISPHGPPHLIYTAWQKGRFELVTCTNQIDEIGVPVAIRSCAFSKVIESEP